MPSLVATASSATANSYATVSEADTYFDERLQAANWSGDSDDKKRALIQATRRIDTKRFEGQKTTTGQALQWPRILAYDDDDVEYDSTAVPAIVKYAMYEEALRILNDNAGSTDTFAPTGLEGFKRAKVGPIEVEIDKGFHAGELTDAARRWLRPVLRSAGIMAELVRS